MSDNIVRTPSLLHLTDARIDELAKETVLRMVGQHPRPGSAYTAEIVRVIRLALAEAR